MSRGLLTIFTTSHQHILCRLQANPDKYKPMLEALLQESGVDFGYSQSSKFANFVNKSLL